MGDEKAQPTATVCITVKCKKALGKTARDYDILKKTKHGVMTDEAENIVIGGPVEIR